MKNIIVGILFLLLLFSNLSSKEIRENYYFESYLSGIKLAEAQGEIIVKNNIYEFKFKAQTIGITDLFFGWKQNIQIKGRIIDEDIFPLMYSNRDFRKNKQGHMTLIYKNNLPFIKSAQPDPRNDKRRKVSKIELLNTLDPASAILSIGLFLKNKKKCNISKPIFDGKRRYNIVLKYMGLEKIIDSNKLDNKSTYMKCSFSIQKISGYTKKELKKYPSEGILWYNSEIQTNIKIPDKIMINTIYGKYINYLKKK